MTSVLEPRGRRQLVCPSLVRVLMLTFLSFFQSLKLDLDFKDEKISSLNKELEDLQTGGASEEEVANLKRQKHELEMRLKEQARSSR